ncbi:MAG: hypothetical protein ACJA0P_003096 [Planctomycetota bacterium]|jgi:hypothetical protein
MVALLPGRAEAQGLPAGVIAVDAAAANNAGLGTDWSTALRDLDAALQMVATSRTGSINETWVKKGRYMPIDLTGGAREQNTIAGGPGTDGGLVTGAISDMGCFETLMDGN